MLFPLYLEHLGALAFLASLYTIPKNKLFRGCLSCGESVGWAKRNHLQCFSYQFAIKPNPISNSPPASLEVTFLL